jgi:hypothetical protein
LAAALHFIGRREKVKVFFPRGIRFSRRRGIILRKLSDAMFAGLRRK